jgi:hypothetical protein
VTRRAGPSANGRASLHLIKLCVGAESIADLERWIGERLAERARRGDKREQVHTTRMAPKRGDELLRGGSLYWVIRGQVAARQRLTGLRSHIDKDGISRCDLVLDPAVVRVLPRPSRPFQGWRYLAARDAPPDLDAVAAGAGAMPEEMRRNLRALGLL